MHHRNALRHESARVREREKKSGTLTKLDRASTLILLFVSRFAPIAFILRQSNTYR